MGRNRSSSMDAVSTSTENMELERSWNPLVRLGIAFKKAHRLAPASHPLDIASGSPLTSSRRISRENEAPLVDITAIQKFMRQTLAIKKPISTLPDFETFSPVPATDHLRGPISETSQGSKHPSSEGTFSSSPSSLPPHDAASGAHVFDVGMVGHPIIELEGKEAELHMDSRVQYSWFVDPPTSDPMGQRKIEMEDVQEYFRRTGEIIGRISRWGLPETSWKNKMPWYSPPPQFLTRGLQWPPRSFASEEEKLMFYRNARKRKRYLTGCPPTWSFMVANVALIAFLVYNPVANFLPR